MNRCPGEQVPRSPHRFDVGNLRLLPHFNESDPDMFFLLFERVARAREWPDADCARCFSVFSQEERSLHIPPYVWKRALAIVK